MFDYLSLRNLIAEKGFTQKVLSTELGISENSFTNKIKGHTYFTALEIAAISKILCIPTEKVGLYFFTDTS